MRQLRLAAVALLAALSASGCGSDLLKTKGRIVKGGEPFKVAKDEYVRVTFVPVLPPGERPKDLYVAEFNRKNATFHVAGKDLRGMPPGKYRVSIAHERKRNDLFKGKFDAVRSPFVYDVDAGTREIVIDLDNPPLKG